MFSFFRHIFSWLGGTVFYFFLHRLVGVVVGLILLFVVITWGVGGLFPPAKKLTPERREAMTIAIHPLLTRMPKSPSHITRLLVAPLTGDYTGEVSQYLRDTLDAEGYFNVVPPSAYDRVRKEMHLEPAAFNNLDLALRIARDAQCQQLLWGSVNRLSQQGKQLAVDLDMGLYDVASGRQIWKDASNWKSNNIYESNVHEGSEFSLTDFAATIPGMLLSIMLSILCAIFFALVMTPAIMRVLERESNGLNLFLLITLSLADSLMMVLIMRRSFAGLTYMVLTILLTIAALWYNFWYCEFLDKRR